jgi:hypothetical protein
MTDREFRRNLNQKRLEAIRADVLAGKKKPPTSEKETPPKVRKKRA